MLPSFPRRRLSKSQEYLPIVIPAKGDDVKVVAWGSELDCSQAHFFVTEDLIVSKAFAHRNTVQGYSFGRSVG